MELYEVSHSKSILDQAIWSDDFEVETTPEGETASSRPMITKFRKVRKLSKLYQPTNKLTGLPYKGRAKRDHTRLYAFPVFDQSAALMNLPVAMITHLNSGNMDGYTRLLLSHFEPTCEVQMSMLPAKHMNIRSVAKFMTYVNELYPDQTMCLRSLKVDGLHIKASIYSKFTASNLITEVVSNSLTDSSLTSFVGQSRSTFMVRMRNCEVNLNEGSTLVCDVPETELDLLLYTRYEMELRVSDVTKQITYLRIDHQITSIEPVELLSKFH